MYSQTDTHTPVYNTHSQIHIHSYLHARTKQSIKAQHLPAAALGEGSLGGARRVRTTASPHWLTLGQPVRGGTCPSLSWVSEIADSTPLCDEVSVIDTLPWAFQGLKLKRLGTRLSLTLTRTFADLRRSCPHELWHTQPSKIELRQPGACTFSVRIAPGCLTWK